MDNQEEEKLHGVVYFDENVVDGNLEKEIAETLELEEDYGTE